MNSYQLICGLDYSPIEGILLDKNPKIFIGNILNENKIYKKHFAYNIEGVRYFSQEIELNPPLKKNVKIKKKIIKNFSIDKKSSEIIANTIDFKFKKKNFFYKIFLKIFCYIIFKPSKLLIEIKKKSYKKITIKDYKRYSNLIKKNLFLSIINKLYDNLFYSLYKVFLFSNFNDHSAYRMSGQQQKIVLKDFKNILYFMKKDLSLNYKIHKSMKYIMLKKAS